MKTYHTARTAPVPIIVCITMMLALLMPVSAYAWTRSANFENGTVGAKAQADDAFDDLAGGSTYTREFSFSGEQAAKLRVKEGSTGFGYFGGLIDLPTKLYKGDEMCITIRARFPSSYVFFDPPQQNKFMRIRTKGPQNGTVWDNIYMNDYEILFEKSASPWHTILNSGPARDRWQTYTWYLRFDNESTKNGGKGLVRFWIDGKKVADFPQVETLKEPDASAHALYVFTWWGNGGPPKDLHLYVDDIVITNEVSGRVNEGKKCIQSPPSAPSISASTND